MEVYNEEINDLLNKEGGRGGKNLRILTDDPVRGAVIDKLTEVVVVDAADLLATIKSGEADRAPVRAFAPAAKDDGALPSGGGKGAGAKRTALPRAALRSKLFGILSADRDSESAALSLKDVNAALGDDAQPEAHLKDVLGEIAAPVRVSGKVHYDLKPEYKDHTAAG